ncbi:MAG TPA: hypothetical protein VHS53_03790 [Mucilaginibacter sp.]|nr:hypothetical protein [Mucilaginibacter sp.]
MRNSFRDSGFHEDICEYLYIDNSRENTYDAYDGINRFLRAAKGRYIILCHQDILLGDRTIDELRAKIADIDSKDPRWAILSNAGGINLKYTAMHVIQKSGNVLHEPLLPLKTETVDENFIVVKSEANLALSADLSGFHLYGTDICLVADILGYSSYVIDFLFIHKSDGNADKRFYGLKTEFIKKYRRAFRSRFIGTTITRFCVSGNRFWNAVGNTGVVLFFARQYFKIFKSKKHYTR